VALARVNDADANVAPVKPVMSAPAAAFVGVGQFFARCRTPLLDRDRTAGCARVENARNERCGRGAREGEREHAR
jgi:hypothetical protein